MKKIGETTPIFLFGGGMYALNFKYLVINVRFAA